MENDKIQHLCETCEYGDWRVEGKNTNPELAVLLHPEHCQGCCPAEDHWKKKEILR